MAENTLYFIGLGLFDETDITLKALQVIKHCDIVFAEFYTSTMIGTSIPEIEKTIGKKITMLTRAQTEKADLLFEALDHGDVAFLTGGDSMTATTHVDLRLQAMNKGFSTQVIHGTSVLTAVPGLLGLQHYKFGRMTTLVTPEKKYFPTSPYDVIKQNKKQGVHTMILLDIQQEKDRYMTASEGIGLLIEMENIRGEHVISLDDMICVVARAGSTHPVIKAGVISRLRNFDFGPPLHTLVFPGDLHFMEQEALKAFSV